MVELSVSYVVSIYNKSFYIPYVVDAIFNQEGVHNCEYIFIDDGSTDDSLDVLKQCTKGHNNVKIIHQENAGPAVATNRGIFEASCPYIKFVDGDDILHPRSTLELFNAMSKHGAGLAHSLIEQITFPSTLSAMLVRPLSEAGSFLITDSLAYVSEKALFNLTCVLVSTDLAKRSGGCDERVFIQDYSVILRLANRTPFAVVPKVLAFAPMVEEDDRASSLAGGAQVLHDLNLALGYFLRENKDIPRALQNVILKKTIGRAWKWAHRHGNTHFFSSKYMSYCFAVLAPQFLDIPKLILESCMWFRATSAVKLAPTIDKPSVLQELALSPSEKQVDLSE